MKKITQRRSNLRCVFSGKADSLPCEARKENPIFYNQRSVFVFGFDYQSYHLPFNSTIPLLRVQHRWPHLHNGVLLDKKQCFSEYSPSILYLGNTMYIYTIFYTV